MKKLGKIPSFVVFVILTLSMLYPIYYYGTGLFSDSVYFPDKRGFEYFDVYNGAAKYLLCISILLFFGGGFIDGMLFIVRSIRHGVEGDKNSTFTNRDSPWSLRIMATALILFVTAFVVHHV